MLLCSCPKPIKPCASDLLPFCSHGTPSHPGRLFTLATAVSAVFSVLTKVSPSLAVQIYNVSHVPWSLHLLELLCYTSLLLSHLPPYCAFKKPGRLCHRAFAPAVCSARNDAPRFLSNSPLSFLQVFAQMVPFSAALPDTQSKSLLCPLKPYPPFLFYFSSQHLSPLT